MKYWNSIYGCFLIAQRRKKMLMYFFVKKSIFANVLFLMASHFWTIGFFFFGRKFCVKRFLINSFCDYVEDKYLFNSNIFFVKWKYFSLRSNFLSGGEGNFQGLKASWFRHCYGFCNRCKNKFSFTNKSVLKKLICLE